MQISTKFRKFTDLKLPYQLAPGPTPKRTLKAGRFANSGFANSANARAQMRHIQNKLMGTIKGWNKLLTWKGHTCECSMSLS
jgi:hypothetical protein